MAKRITKKTKELQARFDNTKEYSIAEAITTVKNLKSAKFDETVEIALRLNVNPKHADQMIRGSVVLPAGTGKNVRVAVVAKELKADEAKEAGADIVGSDDLIADIQAGNINFDVLIATPNMMGMIGKVGRILGPKGLMPNPKVGTVSMDVAQAVKNAKGGQVSFSQESINENLTAFVKEINRLKPASAKGRYIKNATLSLTMSPSVKVDPMELLEIK